MRTFAKNPDGSLAVFDAEADTYAEAIAMVKTELGVERALVLVQPAKKE